MDVEGTIHFILEAQANAEVRMQKAELRMDKIDKRLDAITKLIQQGMRMLVKHDKGMAEIRVSIAQLTAAQKRTDARFAELAEQQKRTDVRFAELAQAQKATERSLKAFIDSMRHGRNGH